MKQYWEIKALHKEEILLFRMGDFYEMFFDDAIKASSILGIALTSRNKKSADETPMCGVPYHSIAGPINKLLAQGLKVAICEQVEDPKTAKGIVKRAVTRILTPGMVYDVETLEFHRSYYIAALDQESLSLLDTSTAEAKYFLQPLEQSLKVLELIQVAEMIVSEDHRQLVPSQLQNLLSVHEGLWKSQIALPQTAQRILSYVQKAGLSPETFEKRFHREVMSAERLHLSSVTCRHLELFESYAQKLEGSLYWAINRTKTSMGARLLRQWMTFPLRDLSALKGRQDKVDFWIADLPLLKKVRELLGGMGDLERRFTKATSVQAHGRDLISFAESLKYGIASLEYAEHFPERNEALSTLVEKILTTLVEDPPMTVKQGGMVRKGVSSELDEWIEISTNSQALVESLEKREKESTGISSLKIRYNNVFGYYIEITNTHKEKVPAHYLRKQTLANAERYYTEELIELEKKVLKAQSVRSELEFKIFEELKEEIKKATPQILRLSHQVAEMDVLSSFAALARERSYTKPEVSETGISVVGLRHPVIEQFQKGQFVANDLKLDQGELLLLTGPNMAGKSTFMRQVALNAILHQIGSYVAADQAKLPLFDRIFTRIGASDMLTEGLSTFMVEMTETASILREVSASSLVIMDEIGRGTSTFDGMSLAQAICEYLLSEKSALTLFATHYHELTELAGAFPQMKVGHLSVQEKDGNIRFLYSFTSGPAKRSYGIQVAKLAGLPAPVIQRAQKLLKEKESLGDGVSTQLSLMSQALIQSEESSPLAEKDQALQALIQEVQEFSLSTKTPLDAMIKIAQWQQQISKPS
ncbi:MAG: DNA mismatch repair protein MutS [Proteobacteria bacterium]|nr:DNA mismatch repair protein MutS [Pseudomonadota bacterium]